MTTPSCCTDCSPPTQDREAVRREIERLRQHFGKDLAIFGHHYQADEVIEHVDISGDSLELSRKVPGLPARHIVFCGVYFMAESAVILAGQGQKVYIPELDASCVMSEMAPAARARAVIERLVAGGRRIVPLAYVNTQAEVKALCGRYGGSVCTSANAPKMLAWALETAGSDGAVLFLPDRNLAWNTADRLGLPENKRLILDIRGDGSRVDLAAAAEARLLVWPGLCAIHHRFKAEHVRAVRRKDPDATVVVHPECTPEVVGLADAAGSTSFIIDYVAKAPAGAAIAIGTEIHLVRRLMARHPDKRLWPLLASECSCMASVTAEKLLRQLQDLAAGTAVAVEVPGAVRAEAQLALERMLEVSR